MLGWIVLTNCGCGQKAESDVATAPQSSERDIEQLLRRLGAAQDFDYATANAKLAKFESTCNELEQQLTDAEAIATLQDELKEFVDTLPPIVQDAWLSRILPLDWNIRASSVAISCRDAGTTGVEPDSYELLADEIEHLLSTRPDNTSESLVTEITQHLASIESRLETDRAAAAIATAKKLLSTESSEGVDAALLALDPLADQTKDVEELRDRLRVVWLVHEVNTQCSQLQGRLKLLETQSDRDLQQAGLSQLYESALQLKLELLRDESVDATPLRVTAEKQVDALVAESRDAIRSIAGQAEEDQQKRLREYQKWALEQISNFNQRDFTTTKSETEALFATFKSPTAEHHWTLLSEFEEVARLVSMKTGVQFAVVESKRGLLTPDQQKAIYEAVATTFSWNYTEEIAQLTSREAAAKYLLPIEQSLLEPPVQQLYSKAFQNAWNTAEAAEHQLELAKKTVTVKKKSLSDF